jgi:hypothetical protein
VSFDLAEPSLPHERKQRKGLLSKLFGRGDAPATPVAPAPAAPPASPAVITQSGGLPPLAAATPQGTASTASPSASSPSATAPAATAPLDLEEIKRKLGLEEEDPVSAKLGAASPTTTKPQPTEKAAQRPVVQIADWTHTEEVTAPVAATPSPFAAPPQPTVDASTASHDAETAWSHETGPAVVQEAHGYAATTHEDLLPTAEWSTEVPIAPTQDWAKEHPDVLQDDAPSAQPSAAPKLPTDWTATPEPSPIHHEYVEKQFAAIDKKQAKVAALVQPDNHDEHDQHSPSGASGTARDAAAASQVALQEWHLQEKELPPEQYFILRNGQPVKSLQELMTILDYIDDTTFDHHVNDYRNDFATWIENAVGDVALAQQIRAATDRDSMAAVLRAKEYDAKKALAKASKAKTAELAKLQTVDDQVQQLRTELATRVKELAGERKRSSKLVKDKLDAEVKRLLEQEKQALLQAREQLHLARKEYEDKQVDSERLKTELANREKEILIAEQRAQAAMSDAREAKEELSKEKATAEQLLRDADKIRAEYEALKALDAKNQAAIDELRRTQDDIRRREEALKAREEKVNTDLTSIQEERERLAHLKAECDEREATAKRVEQEALNAADEAETRTEIAIKQERDMSGKLKEDVARLEKIRTEVDKMLSKVMGEKKRTQEAVEVRKQLEEAILRTKEAIVEERKEMEADSYAKFNASRATTQPAGAPTAATVPLSIGKKDLPIYAKIETCRSAIDKQDLTTAKRLYTELREEFPAADVHGPERNALYNAIRELYDDIHLLMLG